MPLNRLLTVLDGIIVLHMPMPDAEEVDIHPLQR